MNPSKLSKLQSAASSDASIVTDFLKSDNAQRTQMLTRLSSDKGLDLSDSDISEIIGNPEELMSGMELSDEALALAAGGGKGDATNTVGGNQSNSNVNISGGGTTTTTDGKVSG